MLLELLDRRKTDFAHYEIGVRGDFFQLRASSEGQKLIPFLEDLLRQPVSQNLAFTLNADDDDAKSLPEGTNRAGFALTGWNRSSVERGWH